MSHRNMVIPFFSHTTEWESGGPSSEPWGTSTKLAIVGARLSWLISEFNLGALKYAATLVCGIFQHPALCVPISRQIPIRGRMTRLETEESSFVAHIIKVVEWKFPFIFWTFMWWLELTLTAQVRKYLVLRTTFLQSTGLGITSSATKTHYAAEHVKT